MRGETAQPRRPESDEKPRYGKRLGKDEEGTEPSRKAQMLELGLEPLVGNGVIQRRKDHGAASPNTTLLDETEVVRTVRLNGGGRVTDPQVHWSRAPEGPDHLDGLKAATRRHATVIGAGFPRLRTRPVNPLDFSPGSPDCSDDRDRD